MKKNIITRGVYCCVWQCMLCYGNFHCSWSKNAIFWKESKFHIRKIEFRSFWSHFSQRKKIFQGKGWIFPVSTFKKEFFNEKVSSLVCLTKKLFSFPQKYRFWPFLTTCVHLQSQFFQRTGKISKISWSVSWGGGYLEYYVKFWDFYLQKGAAGGLAVLQVGIFQNPWF